MMESWFKDTRHKIIVMTAVIFLLGAMVGRRFFIGPDFRTLKDLANQITAESHKEEALRRLSDLDNKIKSYDKYFAKTDDSSWLIETVNRLAKESGVVLVSLTPMQPEAGEGLDKLVLRVEALCGYHELGNFASRIENEAHFVKISGVEAQSQTGSQASGQKLAVTMAIAAYHPRQSASA